MKIAILSFQEVNKDFDYGELRLKEEAVSLGHEADIYRNADCQLFYKGGNVQILHRGEIFPTIDALIARPNILWDADIKLSLLKQFSLRGVKIFNSYESIIKAKNKIRTFQILQSAAIPVPSTIVLENMRLLDDVLQDFSEFPLIIKDPFGTYGTGVIIAESKRSLRSILEYLSLISWNKQFIIQEFIKEADSRDIRVFVVGGKVIAAMQRKARGDEFRSNAERGGECSIVEIPQSYKQIAIDSTKILGLDIAGVDIIESHDGPKVLEVNANPGFKALEKVSGINVARKIVEFVSNVNK